VQQTEQPLAGRVHRLRSNSTVADETRFAIECPPTACASGYGYPSGYLFDTLRGLGLVYQIDAQDSPG